MVGRNLARQREAEPHALWFAGDERLAERLCELGRRARPAIDNLDGDFMLLTMNFDGDRAPRPAASMALRARLRMAARSPDRSARTSIEPGLIAGWVN